MGAKRSMVLALLLCLCSICLMPALSLSAPPILNYQGTLTDDQGAPVTGAVPMVFRLYATIDATPAQALWDSGTVSVPVVNGAFSIDLGDTSTTPPQPALSASIFSDDTRYLGITVNGQELVPRKRLASVPYAMSGGVPKGAIIMWSGAVDQIPVGWALCDGAERALPDGSKITPPDLRDRFIVGAGLSYSRDAKSDTLNYTININHTHTVNDHTHGMNHTHTYSGQTGDVSATSSKSKGDYDVADNHHSHGYSGTTSGPSVGSTSGASDRGTDSRLNSAQDIRPPYYSLAFIMKL